MPRLVIRHSSVLLLATLAVFVARPAAGQRAGSDSVFRLPDITRSIRGDSLDRLRFAGALSHVLLDPTAGVSGRLDQAFLLIPGVLAQSRSGGVDLRITIRGFGARGAGDRSNAGTMRGVRVMIDGFPETEPDGRTALDLMDLGTATSLQVLRSNASATWGNAAGGVISLSTLPIGANRDPSTQVTLGGFGLRRSVTRYATSVSGSTFYGGLTRTVQDGWRQNSNGQRSLLNLGFTGALGTATSLRVTALGAVNQYNIPGPLTAAQLAADPEQANATYLARRERRDNQTLRLGAEVVHQLSDGLAVSAKAFVTPKHLERSERGTYRYFDRVHRGGSLLLEDYLGAAGTLSAGVDFARQDGPARFWSLTATGEQGQTISASKNEKATNTGVFVQHGITLGQRLSLTSGLRYDAIDYGLEDSLAPKLNATRRFSRVTPKLGLSLQVAPAAAFYASLGGGVEAPAANETDAPGTFGQDTVTGISPLLAPIRSTTVEVGFRHSVASSGGVVTGLSYDVAAYQTRVRNEVVPYRGGRFYFTAGRAERRGLEASAQAALKGGVGVSVSAALQDHQYTRYVVDSVHYGKAGAVADYSGNDVVGVPRALLGGELRLDPAFAPALRVALGAQRVGDYFADDANRVVVPASVTASLSVATRDVVAIGGGLGLRGSATIANLFDRANVASAFLNPDLVGGQPAAFEPGLPRHLIIGMSLEWLRSR